MPQTGKCSRLAAESSWSLPMDTDSMVMDRVDTPSTPQSTNWTWMDDCLSASRTLSPTGTDVQAPLHRLGEHILCKKLFSSYSTLASRVITTYFSLSPVQWTGSSSASGRNIFWLSLTPLMASRTLSTAFSTGTQLVNNTPPQSEIVHAPWLPLTWWYLSWNHLRGVQYTYTVLM